MYKYEYFYLSINISLFKVWYIIFGWLLKVAINFLEVIHSKLINNILHILQRLIIGTKGIDHNMDSDKTID